MDSYSLFKFAVRREFEVEGQKGQRIYQFELQPGSPWEEIMSSLDELKLGMLKLEEEAKAKEAADQAKPDQVLEAEVVA